METLHVYGPLRHLLPSQCELRLFCWTSKYDMNIIST